MRHMCTAAHRSALLFVFIFLALLCPPGIAIEGPREGSRKSPLEDPGDKVPVTLRPILPPGVPQAFDFQDFEAHPTASFCHIYPWRNPNVLECTNVSHEGDMYVNLELIEPLLVDQRVICDETTLLGQETQVVLEFIEPQAIALAHDAWSSKEDLVFLTEDPHCFQNSGDRSFYASNRVDWDFGAMKATIHALPIDAMFQSESGWVQSHEPTFINIPKGTYAQPRKSSGYFHYRDQTPNINPAQFEWESAVLSDMDLAPSTLVARNEKHRFQEISCVRGLLDGFLLAGPVSCAVAVPLNVLEDIIIGAHDPPKGIVAGIKIGKFSPILGSFVAGLSLLATPHLEWTRGWRHDFNQSYEFPWGSEKAGEHVRLPSVRLDCPGCKVYGNATGSMVLKYDLKGRHHKGPLKCLNKKDAFAARQKRDPNSGPKVDTETWHEIMRVYKHAQRAQQEHHGLTKRSRTARHDKLFPRDAICPETDPFWPFCNYAEVRQYHHDCDQYLDSFLLHPTDVVREAIKCVFLSLGHHEECWEKFAVEADQFRGFGDYALKFVQRHLDEAKLRINVTEPMDILLQPRISVDITVGMWQDLDISIDAIPVPSYGFFTSVGGSSPVIVNGGKTSTKVTNKAKEKGPKGYGSLGTGNGYGKMTWGFPVLRLEAFEYGSINANITLPGLKARIDKGMLEIDLLKPEDDIVQSTLPIDLEYLDGNIALAGTPAFALGFSMGVAFDVSITPSMFEGSKKSSKLRTNYITAPIAIGAHAELVRLDFVFGGASANDVDCVQKYGAFDQSGYKFEVIFRIGFKAYCSFWSIRIATDQIGKLQDTSYGIKGLYSSHRLALHCKMTDRDIAQAFVDDVNEVLATIQEPIRHAVEELSNKLDGLRSHEYTMFEGSDIDLLAAKVNTSGVKPGYESFKFAHGLQYEERIKLYMPDALPEPVMHCLTHLMEPMKDRPDDPSVKALVESCKHPKQNMTYNYKEWNEKQEQQASALASVMSCKWIGCPTSTAGPSTLATVIGEAPTPVTTPSSPVTTDYSAQAQQASQSVQSAFDCKMYGNCIRRR